MPDRVIKKLSEFGEGFKHHHENYEASSISQIRETGGVWELGPLKFTFPEHFGFCYGVDKAIDMVFETCVRYAANRIFMTDQLIHNPYINGKLREKGVHYLKRDPEHLLICDELKAGDVVVISAFGTDFRDVQKLKDKGVTVVDSTCGAIVNVWTRVSNYAKQGAITVMHGKRNHEETRATVSQAVKSGGHYITIENKKEALDLADMIAGKLSWGDFMKKYPEAGSPGIRFDVENCKMGMANQTTMLKGESLEIQEMLRGAFRARFGDAATAERFKSFDTICGATQDRQDAMRHLLEKNLDLVLVVGGFNSSNTTHLAELSVGRLPYFHIESAEDIRSLDEIRVRDAKTGSVEIKKGWFPKNAASVGITSGASTPDVTLLEIIRKLCALRAA